jgi:Tfp pilus assembly protein PilV
MVVIVILSVGIIGAYGILGSGNKLAQTTESRIQAINIAREGLEAIENIRDTNWIQLSSNMKECWNTLNYNNACIIGGPSDVMSGTYVLEKNENGNWTLSGIETPPTPSTFSTYKNTFKVMLDEHGLTTQSGAYGSACSSTQTKECQTPFTREILIIPEDNTMSVSSRVYWVDSSSTEPHKVMLETTLTNWK